MLIAELPDTAVLIAPGEWDDPGNRTKYFVDPHNPALVTSRGWEPAEIDAANLQQSLRRDLGTRLTASVPTLLQNLVDDIGRDLNDPDLIKDHTSLNGIIKSTADPYIRALAKFVKRADKAVIAQGKVAFRLLDDDSTGN